MRKPTITEALIGAAALIIAALIGIYPSLRDRKPDEDHKTKMVIAGTVVDNRTNQGIGQATITIAGRTENYVTEDSGNFRIELHGNEPQRLRLHVSKDGFQPADQSVEPPDETLIIPLHKQ